MKIIYSLAALVVFSVQVQAAIAGYPVVLVHGFQPEQLKTKPTGAAVTQYGEYYWQNFWNAKADARIDWPSQERLKGKITTDYVWPKLKQLSVDKTCQNGCIFVTHSTGDLVSRYIIDNQALWLKNAGMAPLNIVATFDFAGAGGGTELADLAINAVTGGGVLDASLRMAITFWLGEVPNATNVGVVQDLRVNTSRQLAAMPQSRVPRLRFAGASSAFFGVTSPFIPGNDDGVVPPHSSCGASAAAGFDSCSKSVAFDGKLSSQNGVSNFMPYHYPVLMSQHYTHSNLIDAARRGPVTAVNSSNNYLDGKVLQFSTYDESRGWWIFKYQYRVVKGSENQSMSELLYRTANQG